MSPQLDPDETAVVIDEHTGRVQAHFLGLGATQDANSFLRQCKAGRVDHLNSAVVVTGNEAKKALKRGRL